MHSSFQKLFDELESQRKKTLDAVSHLGEEQLNKPLAPDKWSISQILSHLITAERISLLYIQKKMLGVDQLADSGFWEDVKMNLLKISQRLPGLKFKAPKQVIDNTKFYRDLSTIQQEWEQVRISFKSLLEKIPDEHVDRKVYRHVRVGYLNVKHCLMFLHEHIIHHTPQIKKLVNQK